MNKIEWYKHNYQSLHQTKIRHTKEKIADVGYMDQDDYNTLICPEGFDWEPVAVRDDGSFYSFNEWSTNFRDLMEKYPPYVDPHNALAGGMYFFMSKKRKVEWNPKYNYDHLKPMHELYNITPGIGAQHHMCGDPLIGLEIGWGGLLKKVRFYKKKHGKDKQAFYLAEEDIILGIQSWIKNLISEIESQIQTETDSYCLENLKQMKICNEYLIVNKPETLRQACQFLSHYNQAGRTYNRDGAGGQLDEMLRPYYEQDIADGIIDDDDAVFFIAGVLLSDTKYYQLSGPDKNGKDMTSHISYLVLEAAEKLNISANLTIRVHDGLDEDFYLKSVEYLFKNKNGWPRYSGDSALVKGFMKLGYSIELARQRIAVGCNWMGLPRLEYPINDTIKINAAKVFEVAMLEVFEAGEPSTQKIWSAFGKHLYKAIQITAEGIDFHLAHQWENAPELFLNLFMDGPIELGLDISNGAAQMYNIGIDGVGIAIVANSFAALEQRIEVENKITWADIIEVIRNNYAGIQGERLRLLMKNCDNYGRGNSRGDKWGRKISKLFTDMVVEKNTPGGTKLVPGWFSWSRTIIFGKLVGATPDGRRAGEPINHNANPLPGFRVDAAATALSNIVAQVQCGYGNTTPLQLELDPGITEAEGGVKIVAELLRTHLQLGGTLINVNIVDADEIRAAHADPNAFPDLIVRVTGFTAYFMALSPEFRQLVVDRIIDKAG